MAKRPSSITVYATPEVGIGETVYIYGWLVDTEMGMPLGGRAIVITATGLAPFTVWADYQQGRYSAQVTFPTSGSKMITANFQGDAVYEGC